LFAEKQISRREEMAARFEVYKCDSCGNMVEMVHEGKGQMICCGKPMRLMKENIVDASTEKHVPVMEKLSGGILVKVGTVPHPMEKDHYIEWIEVVKDGKTLSRQYLNPGDVPEAKFASDPNGLVVREFCNLHGIWKA
jgi:superoxide reductase